jgi:hypothetical protein
MTAENVTMNEVDTESTNVMGAATMIGATVIGAGMTGADGIKVFALGIMHYGC